MVINMGYFTKREVNMAEYCPSSFLFCAFLDEDILDCEQSRWE